jgi:hypothetical protein
LNQERLPNPPLIPNDSPTMFKLWNHFGILSNIMAQFTMAPQQSQLSKEEKGNHLKVAFS